MGRFKSISKGQNRVASVKKPYIVSFGRDGTTLSHSGPIVQLSRGGDYFRQIRPKLDILGLIWPAIGRCSEAPSFLMTLEHFLNNIYLAIASSYLFS
jgi:hypothetical protein